MFSWDVSSWNVKMFNHTIWNFVLEFYSTLENINNWFYLGNLEYSPCYDRQLFLAYAFVKQTRAGQTLLGKASKHLAGLLHVALVHSWLDAQHPIPTSLEMSLYLHSNCHCWSNSPGLGLMISFINRRFSCKTCSWNKNNFTS